MTPFRGISTDVGTAFEMGFMRALNKKVIGYTNVSELYFERTAAYYESKGKSLNQITDGKTSYYVDPNEMSVENFDMVDNLMLEGAVLSNHFIVHKLPATVNTEELFTSIDAFESAVKTLSNNN